MPLVVLCIDIMDHLNAFFVITTLVKKNSPENCVVDLGRDTRTRTQSRRLVLSKGASWSLNWPSGANLLAHVQLKCILYVPL
jgi:hypothetical protein